MKQAKMIIGTFYNKSANENVIFLFFGPFIRFCGCQVVRIFGLGIRTAHEAHTIRHKRVEKTDLPSWNGNLVEINVMHLVKYIMYCSHS